MLAVLAVYGFTSCGEDYLDRPPKHGYVGDNYYTNDEAVIKALEPLYGYAWHGYNERAIVGMGSFRANDAWSPYLQGEFARFTITGLTPVDFYRKYHIERAAQLMRNEGLTVSEACYRTGFSDPKYFTKVFKKFIGQTPSDYRNCVEQSAD